VITMYKFAHMADCHIGAWRDETLRSLNLQAFEQALDICLRESVDFIIISGDLFHTNFPDLQYVKQAVEKLQCARNKDIPIYMVYGSHDYNPNTVSIIDVLESTELFAKVSQGGYEDETLELQFIEDPATGAKITGLPGRKTGLEKPYFEHLNTKRLEQAPGFKIFLFHTSITEMNPGFIPEGQSVPISLLPKGFDYYAGGNIHKKQLAHFKDHPYVVYPGPLFATDFRDLEAMAQGETRGFYIAEFEDTIHTTTFVEVETPEVLYHTIDAENHSAKQVEDTLLMQHDRVSVTDKIVLFRVSGTLSVGRPVDIDFRGFKELLLDRGAVYANINRYALKSQERRTITIQSQQKSDIETRIFTDRIREFTIDPAISNSTIKQRLTQQLTADQGATLAHNLLNALRVEKQEGETNADFHNRVLQSLLAVTHMEANQ